FNRNMSTNSHPILYSYWASSCSWRVRIALNLKDISYDIKPTSLLKTVSNHAYTPEYLKVNPMQKVPALKIGKNYSYICILVEIYFISQLNNLDGHSLCDSVAIMHYLEQTRPQPTLLPQDLLIRAKVNEIVQLICSGIQPLQNVGVLEHIGKDKSLEWAQHWISRGFSGLEKILGQSAGKYCVGNELTMADICLVPQVHNAKRYKVDLSPYPTIVRLDKELLELEVFKSTHPFKQPDCPPEFAIK
ncbi:hypothetical protein KR200_005585, partial [Drosophila serrata]